MNWLVTVSKEKPLLFTTISVCVKYIFFIGSLFQTLMAILRKHGLRSNRYRGILQLKNLHKGKRCFIIATGPSLTREDLKLVENQYTFGMNSICLLEESNGFRPTYYGIQDINVYEKLESSITAKYKGCSNVLVASRIASRYKIPKEWRIFPYNFMYHSHDRWFNQLYLSKFSDNCYSMVYDGFTITFSLIQLAMYMGFGEIYLLGADCDYSNTEKQHFLEYGIKDPTINESPKRMLSAYLVAKKYADKSGVKIINATRGGNLEVFERKSLEDILIESSICTENIDIIK